MSIFPNDESDAARERSCLVLLVDDQLMIAEALRRILDAEPDIDFHYCNDSGQTLAITEQIMPTVILLDLVMPEIDGLTVLRYLRANPRTKDIPVVVLSAMEESVNKAEAFGAGANDYLIKWPDRIELLARIRYHCKWFMTLKQRDEAFQALRVSQRKLAQSNLLLQRLASIDGLTGISNRRYFDECLEKEWRRCARDGDWLTLILLDIDHFKEFNDLYGHLAGDECLKKVATAISECIMRPGDVVARFGGEEFILLLPGTDPEGAEFIAEKVRKAVEALGIRHEGIAANAFVTVSAGTATTVPGQGTDACSFLGKSDTALYEAKGSGRNRVVAALLNGMCGEKA